MTSNGSSSRPRPVSLAVSAAYAAAVLFALHLATYFVPSVRDATLAGAAGVAIALAVLAVAQHAVVFPVVAMLPALIWARVAGYVWLVVDMGTDLAQLGGVSKSVYLPVRLAVNLLAALWIASASWPQRGIIRALGVFVALDFASYSLLGLSFAWVFFVTLPSLVLLPVWFVLVGRRMARGQTRAFAATGGSATAD